MLGEFEYAHVVDEKGNPTGGASTATGVDIKWQDGPLAVEGFRKKPNGAFVETVLAIVKNRIEFYQRASKGKFACRENQMAIAAIAQALYWLDQRTRDRERRGVEGTHQE